ncbi:MAG TPA: class I SAM-dependent methyltransferase [Aggregatilinea sp.]|jgi:SAM-dependent methyltransferase|uniref:class I SAM-dependent methyltransferase n=1 Tax=Aggregatilinea sp. TaxID=2806333 RepID=UPI002C1C074F|nr:class I SAM-dependent methyltransferase [Aggregatilinea sp.]HML23217.1 class I SAM-dependent methyltransferase [Aggregatilinea sp.]
MTPAQPNYGNWIRKRILLVFLAVGSGALIGALLPVPLAVRLVLLGISGLFLFGFVYFTYAYVQFSAQGGNLQTPLRNLVLDYLSWDGEGKALDIGTGNGPLAIRLAQKYPHANVVGIDNWGKDWEYSRETCTRNAAIEQVGNRVQFQKASAARLPFDDETFDAAVSHFVFHEVSDAPDKRDVIQEALRVLREGGVFSFHDLFLDEKIYGTVEDLLETIRSWGVQQVAFVETGHQVHIPPLLRSRRVLGATGIIYGVK